MFYWPSPFNRSRIILRRKIDLKRRKPSTCLGF
jgi:hypothetical protein